MGDRKTTIRSGYAERLGTLAAELDAIASAIQCGPRTTAASATLPIVLAAHRHRFEHFPAGVAGGAGWGILLDLYAALDGGRRLSVSQLYAAAGGAPATASRCVESLTALGLARRSADPADKRRVFVELTEDGAQTVRSYLEAVEQASRG